MENGSRPHIQKLGPQPAHRNLGMMPVLVDSCFLPILSKNFVLGYQNTRWVNPPTPHIRTLREIGKKY